MTQTTIKHPSNIRVRLYTADVQAGRIKLWLIPEAKDKFMEGAADDEEQAVAIIKAGLEQRFERVAVRSSISWSDGGPAVIIHASTNPAEMAADLHKVIDAAKEIAAGMGAELATEAPKRSVSVAR